MEFAKHIKKQFKKHVSDKFGNIRAVGTFEQINAKKNKLYPHICAQQHKWLDLMTIRRLKKRQY